MEVPLARFSVPGLSQSGLVESKLKFRRIQSLPWGALLVGGEFVLPTESQRLHCNGEWKINQSQPRILVPKTSAAGW